MDKKGAIELLERSHHRTTRTRLIILNTILRLRGPFSANDIVEASSKHARGPTVDAVTVYRNLPVFEEVGIICKSDFSDDRARFMVSSPGHDHHHHHIICRKCHKVEPLDFCVLDGQEKILNKMGFTEVKHRLEFTGICRACG